MSKTLVSLVAEVPIESIENEEGWIQVFPFGSFIARDGRPGTLDIPAKTWQLTIESAQEVIRRWEERQTPLVVDYEHQTYETHENGQPAPAAGWITKLVLRENGMFAAVEWTPRAKEYIRSGEYRYISPTFLFDVNTGEVLELCSVALTNNPALDGMEPVHAKDIYSSKRNDKSKQTKNQVVNTVFKKKELGEYDFLETKQKNQRTNSAATRTQVIQLLHEAQEQIAILTRQVKDFKSKEEGLKLEQGIQKALQDGRLQQSCESWARACAIGYPEVLQAFLDASSPLVALVSMQTRQARLNNIQHENVTMLSKEEDHVRSQLGMSVETFIKHKKECQ